MGALVQSNSGSLGLYFGPRAPLIFCVYVMVIGPTPFILSQMNKCFELPSKVFKLDSGYPRIEPSWRYRKEIEVDTHADSKLALIQMLKGGITCEQSRKELRRKRV